MRENPHYLLEFEGGVLNVRSDRFLSLNSRSGVSSTIRLAIRRVSSSQPAIAAIDLNLGLKTLLPFSPLLPLLEIGLGDLCEKLGYLGLFRDSPSVTIISYRRIPCVSLGWKERRKKKTVPILMDENLTKESADPRNGRVF